MIIDPVGYKKLGKQMKRVEKKFEKVAGRCPIREKRLMKTFLSLLKKWQKTFKVSRIVAPVAPAILGPDGKPFRKEA